MTNSDWYLYYAPRRVAALTPERITADRAAAVCDIDAVLARTGLRPDARILEIGCDWGRHAFELVRRGFGAVTSIDIAPAPLALARALASEHDLRCAFHQQDFGTVAGAPYDAILSLYDRSCCGFPTEAEDRRSLQRLACLLRPGGWLVFGINDWPFNLPPASRRWEETADGIELIEVLPNRAEMICTDRVTLLRPDGRRERYELARRHYYLPELRRLLAEAGLDLIAARHRLADMRPYGDGDDGLFVFARRAEDTSNPMQIPRNAVM